jgi:hypothetical protein
MEYDYERADEKRKELELMAGNAISGVVGSDIYDSQQVASEVIKHFASVSAPEKPARIMKMIMLNPGGDSSSRSTKPGNIKLNIKKFITALAGGTLTISGVIGQRWATVLAALVVWESLWASLNIELSEREAATLWTVWKYADEENCISNEGLLDRVNTELTSSGRNSISQSELDRSLGVLQKISCIQRSKIDDSKWWLREWVRVNFD